MPNATWVDPARGFSAISTSSGTITVRDQYDILATGGTENRQRQQCMISIGITGTARHGTEAEQRQLRSG